MVQYNFKLVFIDNNLLLIIVWLAKWALLPREIISLIYSSMELSPFTIDLKYL